MTYIQGDILKAFREGEFNVLLHQTNCVTEDRVSGIAKSIFEEYPGALKAHLNYCVFGGISFHTQEGRTIVNCNAQYYQGSCSDMQFYLDADYSHSDNFQNRLVALENCLIGVESLFYDCEIGIPLIASGLGADRKLKGSMRDLEYFQKFIAPTVEKYIPNCKVYYQ